MTATIGFAMLLIPALYVAFPAISDLLLLMRATLQRGRPADRVVDGDGAIPHILVAVPAHNEESHLGQCLASLARQTGSRFRMTVVVIADNCSDATARVAGQYSVTVLERFNSDQPGKNHAIRHALASVPPTWDALMVLDADSVADPGLLETVARLPGIRCCAGQAYDGLANEYESDLTVLAGLLTRARYDFALRLKMAAGVNCPLTGNGIVIGRDLLERHGWNPVTITEGWELYAAYSIAGEHCVYLPDAKVFAQETRELSQSESQRVRWTRGRLDVLRRTVAPALRTPGLSLAQRADLIAELSSLGPATRGALALVGILATAAINPTFAFGLGGLFSTAFLQPAVYAMLALVGHPNRPRVLKASLFLPRYAVWRCILSIKLLFGVGARGWTRTQRH